MEFLNLHLPKTLRSPEFIGSDPVDRATWLCLIGYCATAENSGRIEDCREWKDRKWQQICGVTKNEVLRECDLWQWDGDSLVVWAYPIDKELEVITNRESGRLGGSKRTQAKTEAARQNGTRGGRPKTQAETQAETETEPKRNPSENPTERKGREGKGKEERESVRGEHFSEQARSIVDAYPRREKIAEALAIVAKVLADGEDFEAMLAGTRACAAVIRTLPSGHMNRYVPAAETFFRLNRWKDDPETLRRQGNQTTGQGKMSDDEARKQLGRRAEYITD